MEKLAYLILAVIIVTAPIPGMAETNEAPQQDDNSQLQEQGQQNENATPQKESVGVKQKMRDASITASIKTKMLLDGEVDALSINVDTVNQVVTLSGSVDSPEQISLAEEMASKTAGVRIVYNMLEVKSTSNRS